MMRIHGMRFSKHNVSWKSFSSLSASYRVDRLDASANGRPIFAHVAGNRDKDRRKTQLNVKNSGGLYIQEFNTSQSSTDHHRMA